MTVAVAGTFLIKTALQILALSPQAFTVFTQTLSAPAVAPDQSIITEGVPCPLTMTAPAGTVHV